ncbi:MAG: hypothetical protein H6634_11860 [Anaerolineales bacterium]|nr:hypothetical protein [Anaerolineales bacterium]
MAEMIQCPVCGAENPSDQKVCQRCQSPLADASFQPGQSPVHKDTGELEAILPQWLRDARESAKETDESAEDSKVEAAKPAASGMDLLAGLQSQAGDEDDEEIPDWLASITGSAEPPKQKTEEPEVSGTHWVETGKTGDFPQSGPSAEEGEVPDWLAGLQSPQPGADEKDELTDWFRETNNEQESQPAPSFDASAAPSSAPASEETPDWLKQMAADAGEQPVSSTSEETPFGGSDWFDQGGQQEPAAEPFEPTDTPDWLKQMAADASTSEQEPSASDAGSFDMPSETPDWLSQMSARAGSMEEEKAPETAHPFEESAETPDWLKQMSADSNAAEEEQSSAPFDISADAPDWFNEMSGNTGAVEQEQTPASSDKSTETPDWLSGLGGVSSEEAAPFEESASAESEPFLSTDDLPSWLSSEPETPASKPEASKKVDSTPRWLQDEGEAKSNVPAWLSSDEKTAPSQDEDEAAPQDEISGDMPDWLKAAAPKSSIFDDPKNETDTAESQPQEDSSLRSAPAFSENAFSSDSSEDLFTEMPDWLSDAIDKPQSSVVPEPITGSDALAPDALPSWVEAMRPAEQNPIMAAANAADQTMESSGALAGLQGVLPSGVGFNPTSKPKAYSLKLNASNEQVKHASILEQVLAAETAPEMITSEKSLGASRTLRWVITSLLLIVTLATSFLNTQIFSTPVGVPRELGFAVAVEQAIPENAPVLVAVDYEAARAGEMEAAAAPFFDNMLLLKHPRLTFIASNEVGAILAERFITKTLVQRNYQSGVTYLNLGYLSGGQLGIRSFAQQPWNSIPRDIANQPAWELPPLQGVTSLDQFAAIILVTDSAESARTWVEQTQDVRGAVPIIVVSSAQATPMIQPYFDSGQVAGIVSGLYGGAILEKQYNNGLPGTARNYWDAYSIGMLLAVLFTFGGGLVSLGLGMRERSASREEEE